MAITFTIETENFKLKERLRLRKWLKGVIENEKKRVGEIGYLFCDDKYLIEVNRQYLQHDTYTDIITFPYNEGDVVSGDILISVERVEENAKKFGVGFESELHRVMVHGVLHLLGQGDKTEKEAKKMHQREDEALKLL